MRLAAFLLFAVIAACGGGGGGSSSGVSAPVAPAPARVNKAHACYFAMVAGDVSATKDHADCVEIGGWNTDQLAALERTLADGRGPVILMLPTNVCLPVVPLDQVKPIVASWVAMLNATGYLDRLPKPINVRICDEPKRSDTEVRAILTQAHAGLATIPATTGARLAMYWNCGDAFPGLAFVDIPGCDGYDWSYERVAAVYRERFENIAPDVFPIFIVGGSDPWRTDPTPYVDKALADGRYWGVEGFCWAACDIYPNGVSTNGLRPLYASQFQRITR